MENQETQDIKVKILQKEIIKCPSCKKDFVVIPNYILGWQQEICPLCKNTCTVRWEY